MRGAVLALALLALAAGGAYWLVAVPIGSRTAQVISIPRRASTRAVARELKRKHLIRSEDAFLAAAYWTREWRHLQTGGFRLTGRMSALEILRALSQGTHRAWRWLTVPEGYTLRQMADRVGEEKLARREDFLKEAAHPNGFRPGFPLPAQGLEGYLFPDTYRVEADASPHAIVAQMLGRFRSAVWEGMFHQQPRAGGRSLQEVVTLASLVEAEAKHDSERPVIAGVIANRLRQGKRLEIDATVQYALGPDRKSRLLNKDLLIESEYNTYLHAGLPPGPICSPGAASLRAALQPAAVPYLYYVAKSDGSHVFSTTFEQHKAAIARIRHK
jgi:UPF0755 protein